MNQSAIAYAIQAMSALPALIQAGIDVTGAIRTATQKMTVFQAENRAPTDAEWADLNNRISRLRNELHGRTPTPPAGPGDGATQT